MTDVLTAGAGRAGDGVMQARAIRGCKIEIFCPRGGYEDEQTEQGEPEPHGLVCAARPLSCQITFYPVAPRPLWVLPRGGGGR